MKKTSLLIAMLLAFTLPFMGSGVARAQTVTATTDCNLDVACLTQEIALLQQLVALYQTLYALQSNVSTTTPPTVDSTQAQSQNNNTGGSSTNSPAPQTQAPAPSPSATVGTSTCQNGAPIIPITLTNLSPSYFVFHASSTDGQGYWGGQSWQNTTNINVDSLHAGSYDYYIKAYTGATAPFTENTWQDTRTLVLDTTGHIDVSSCN